MTEPKAVNHLISLQTEKENNSSFFVIALMIDNKISTNSQYLEIKDRHLQVPKVLFFFQHEKIFPMSSALVQSIIYCLQAI